jgi:MFS superfamily sulfate permease-like transporter
VTAGLPPGTSPGWWPATLFGIETVALLVGVVVAIALIIILAVWRSRRRQSEQEREGEEPAEGLPRGRRS